MDHVLACQESFNSRLKIFDYPSPKFDMEVTITKLVLMLLVVLSCMRLRVGISHNSTPILDKVYTKVYFVCVQKYFFQFFGCSLDDLFFLNI